MNAGRAPSGPAVVGRRTGGYLAQYKIVTRRIQTRCPWSRSVFSASSKQPPLDWAAHRACACASTADVGAWAILTSNCRAAARICSCDPRNGGRWFSGHAPTAEPAARNIGALHRFTRSRGLSFAPYHLGYPRQFLNVCGLRSLVRLDTQNVRAWVISDSGACPAATRSHPRHPRPAPNSHQ